MSTKRSVRQRAEAWAYRATIATKDADRYRSRELQIALRDAYIAGAHSVTRKEPTK